MAAALIPLPACVADVAAPVRRPPGPPLIEVILSR
jgi:hypothetical protein